MVQSLAKLLGWSENQIIEACVGQIIEQSKLPPEERSLPAIIHYAWERRQAAQKKAGGAAGGGTPGQTAKVGLTPNASDAFPSPRNPPLKSR